MFTKEDYVSLEAAKLLKEKGFDEPVLAQYSKAGSVWTCSEPENFNDSKDCFSRPTLYEAQKWLRNELGLYIVVSLYVYVDEYDDEGYPCGTAMYWEVSIYSTSDGFQGKLDRCYDIYEDAFDKGIQEALKLI